jgi:putative polymerase
LGSERSADRLVTLLLFITLGSCLFEFLAPNFYLRFFDVIHYYIARGTVTDIDSDLAAGPYFNGTRVEGRALFPSLGDQRISGIFLEPPSVGNFATIAFAWILLRDRRNFLALTMKIVALSVIAVLADARFGLFFCLFTAVLYMITPLVRPTLLFVAPFLTMLALVAYAGAHWQDSPENTLPGRLLLSGDILSTLNVWQVFGLQATDFKSAASFAANGLGDAGYAYILVTAGLVGMAAIWALFAYTPPAAEDAARFRNFVAFYFTALLSISSAVFTIKTAALLWFLYGVLNRPGRGGGLPAKSASLF